MAKSRYRLNGRHAIHSWLLNRHHRLWQSMRCPLRSIAFMRAITEPVGHCSIRHRLPSPISATVSPSMEIARCSTTCASSVRASTTSPRFSLSGPTMCTTSTPPRINGSMLLPIARNDTSRFSASNAATSSYRFSVDITIIIPEPDA